MSEDEWCCCAGSKYMVGWWWLWCDSFMCDWSIHWALAQFVARIETSFLLRTRKCPLMPAFHWFQKMSVSKINILVISSRPSNTYLRRICIYCLCVHNYFFCIWTNPLCVKLWPIATIQNTLATMKNTLHCDSEFWMGKHAPLTFP